MARKRKRRTRKKDIKLKIRNETVYSVVGLVFITFGILIIISFTGQGEILAKINHFLADKLGLGMIFLPFVFMSAGLVMMNTKWFWSKPTTFLSTLLLMISITVLLKAGTLGLETFTNLANLITPIGTYISFIALFIIALLIMFEASLAELLEFLTNKRKAKEKDTDKAKKKQKDFLEEKEQKKKGFTIPKLALFKKKDKGFSINKNELKTADSKEKAFGTAVVGENLLKAKTDSDKASASLSDSTASTLSNMPVIWDYPPLSLLSDSKGGEANRGDVKANADIIEGTLDSFGIKAKVAEVNYGPSVTQYALKITKGTRLSKITSLATDLALALAAPTGQIRIEAPIAGRSLVGIEVPNFSAQYVTLKTMLQFSKMKKHASKLAVALGINVSGKPTIVDIAQMPHLLIAGATGSGKSVAINAFMCSILFRASPNEVKFILVDPKRVELTGYNGIPHLLTPVIVEPKKVVAALKWAVNLMDKRYKQLAEVGVRNIDAYNELAGLAAMPNIVIVIDELADIMLFAPSEVEESVTRIAQMARAVGIHLVLATQRPSVDVITGLIKANIPARIAFNVSSMTDSRVILDTPGAEKLLGRGDMLFIPPDQAKPSRIQGTFVADQEIRQLINFIKAQGQEPQYEEDITTKYKALKTKGALGEAGEAADRDEKFAAAARLFSKYDKASSSLIQRRLSVGYARAARILDQLYEAGLVGPPEGSKPREVNNAKINEYLGSLQSLEE
ncbi:MAG: DNA translocase FtsK [Candidatus Woesebacteria bacterium]|jgi:S-DNA-T family DNA segregation ATPase FtsK/SpoIIIE